MKIQSKSDIITNSSSEVFLIETEFAKTLPKKYGISFDIVNIDYLKMNPFLIEEICDLAGIEPPKDLDYFDEIFIKDFLEKHKEELYGFFGDDRYTLVLFEEYFCDNDIIESVKEVSIWDDFL